MEVEDAENKDILTVLVKNELNINEAENEDEEQYLEQDIVTPYASCVVKQEPGVEEETTGQFVNKYVLPDVSTIIKDENKGGKEKTAEEEHHVEEYILPDGNPVIKEEGRGETENEQLVYENCLLLHAESSSNSEHNTLGSCKQSTADAVCTDLSSSFILLDQHEPTANNSQRIAHCTVLLKKGPLLKQKSTINSGIKKTKSNVKTTMNSVKLYKCDICDKTYTRNNHSRHQLIHSGVRKYQCNVCKKTFTQSGSLSEHKLIHLGVKNFKCDICDKAFTKAWDLSQHKLVIHMGIRKYQCDVCNRAFSAVRDLADHKLLHAGIAKYQCDVCNKTLSSAKILTRHKSLHKGIKKYQCNVCNKTFNQSGGLSTHRLIHVKRFFCDICYEAFTRPRDVTQHKLVHIGVKYQCKVCKKAFTQSGGLSKHNKLFHSDNLNKTV